MIDKYFPTIIDSSLINKKFDPGKIYESLMRETSLEKEQAEFITSEAIRFIIKISGIIKTITAPMIREVINVVLLQYGREKERLQYTRIGLPFYDISNLEPGYDITKHVLEEYDNVSKLIVDLEGKKVLENELQIQGKS